MHDLMYTHLCIEDRRIIEINELGLLIAVYRIKPLLIRFLQLLCIFFFCLGICGLVFFFFGKNELITGNDAAFILSFCLLCGSLLAGLFILCIELPRAQRQYIVLCEQGLFQVKSKYRMRQVTILYWRNIVAINKLHGQYSILQREHETFILDIFYQKVREIVSIMEERSGKTWH